MSRTPGALPSRYPDRFTRRGQYFGFVSVLASLGVVAYAIYTNHPLIAGIIGALNLVALAAVFVAPDRASKGESVTHLILERPHSQKTAGLSSWKRT